MIQKHSWEPCTLYMYTLMHNNKQNNNMYGLMFGTSHAVFKKGLKPETMKIGPVPKLSHIL